MIYYGNYLSLVMLDGELVCDLTWSPVYEILIGSGSGSAFPQSAGASQRPTVAPPLLYSPKLP